MNIYASLKQPLIMSMSDIDQEKKRPRLLDLTQAKIAKLTPLTTDSIDEQYLEKFSLKNQYNIFYAVE